MDQPIFILNSLLLNSPAVPIAPSFDSSSSIASSRFDASALITIARPRTPDSSFNHSSHHPRPHQSTHHHTHLHWAPDCSSHRPPSTLAYSDFWQTWGPDQAPTTQSSCWTQRTSGGYQATWSAPWRQSGRPGTSWGWSPSTSRCSRFRRRSGCLLAGFCELIDARLVLSCKELFFGLLFIVNHDWSSNLLHWFYFHRKWAAALAVGLATGSPYATTCCS